MRKQPSFTVYSITDCGGLSNPSFGVVSLTGTSFEHVANYSCNAGYQLIGIPTRICLSGASWSGSWPTCEPIGKTKCVVDYSSTRLNAHLIFPLFSEIRKPIPNVLVVKTLFQKCNPPDCKFYLSKLIYNETFPRMV